jgi:hypothetical protein
MSGTTILVASSRTVFRSTNDGGSFRPIAGLTPGGSYIYDVFLGPGGRAGLVYESNRYLSARFSGDGGSHWAVAKHAAGPQEPSYDAVNLVASGATTTLVRDRGDRTGPIYVSSNW